MMAYIAKQCETATANMTSTTHGTTMQCEKSLQDIGPKPYMDN
jgi:hypothetical protein